MDWRRFAKTSQKKETIKNREKDVVLKKFSWLYVIRDSDKLMCSYDYGNSKEDVCRKVFQEFNVNNCARVFVSEKRDFSKDLSDLLVTGEKMSKEEREGLLFSYLDECRDDEFDMFIIGQ